MPNDQQLPTVHNSALINQFSIAVCKQMIPILQHHPELVVANYKSINWKRPEYQSALLAGFKKKISDLPNTVALMPKIREYFRLFLVQSFFDSPAFEEMEAKVLSSIYPSNCCELITQDNCRSIEVSENKKAAFASGAIAILLLDAENLQLGTETEQFLTTVCTYPIQVKIAFANWCSMGKRDVELHKRGYELIHVPVGKDNADGKMITFGSSVHERYANAKEVLVCSSDNVMTNLCNHLQQHGLTVYRVSKQEENLTVFNISTGKVMTNFATTAPEIPTIEQFCQQIKELIKDEQKRTKSCWVKLVNIYQNFKNKYKLSVTQVLNKHFPGQKAKDIFFNYPAEFVVHQIDEASELYITLFQINQSQSAISQDDAITSSAKLPLLASINCQTDLEQALKNIINELTQQSPESYIDIGNLASKFKQQYGKAITEQIKSLQLNRTFVKFLQSCSSLTLQQTTKGWEVAVR